MGVLARVVSVVKTWVASGSQFSLGQTLSYDIAKRSYTWRQKGSYLTSKIPLFENWKWRSHFAKWRCHNAITHAWLRPWFTSIGNLCFTRNYSEYNLLVSKHLKVIKHETSKAITLIVNQFLNTGIFPDKLKCAKVIPIYKKGGNTNLDNYRPISILPTVSTFLERVIFDQLYAHFHQNNLLYSSQYGFKKKHSTELAVLELVDRITQELDKGHTPVNIFLDLSKAFDTLDHNILLHKLSYYGIKNSALDLFKSYLSNRKQYVDFLNNRSTYARLKAKLYWISSDTHQLQLIKLYHLKLERFKSI